MRPMILVGAVVAIPLMLFLFRPSTDESEIRRRHREIEEMQAIVKQAEHDPTDPTPLRKLVTRATRLNETPPFVV